jgi:hypothetical protein
MGLGELTKEYLGEWWDDFREPRGIPDLDAIKRAVAGVAGFHRGRPILRLDWLPYVMAVRMGRTQPANLIYEIQVPAHEYYDDERRLFINEYATVRILLPRFGIRQLLPDSVGRPNWERDRYITTKKVVDGVVVLDREDVYGPYPTTGYYRELPGDFGMIARHLPGRLCCRARLENKENCYGTYLPPTWELVEKLREGWARYLDESQTRMPEDDPTDIETARTAAANLERQEAYAAAEWERLAGEPAEFAPGG